MWKTPVQCHGVSIALSLLRVKLTVGDSKLTGGIHASLLTTTILLLGNKEFPKLVFIMIFY